MNEWVGVIDMSQLTFIDKIEVLGKLLVSSPVIIGISAFSLLLMIVLFLSNKLNKKVIKIIFIIIYLALFGYTIFKYGSYFLTSIDSFITLFMANIYFPTIPVYVFIMIISFIIMIFTFNSKTKNKIVKIINVVFFTLIQMLFVIFIFIVETTKIDVSSNQNIYTNEQTLTLLELGMGLFVIWIVILLIALYLKKADKIFKTKKEEKEDDFDEYINDYIEPTKVKAKPKKISKKQLKEEKPIINNNQTEYQYNNINTENKYDPANYNNGQFDGFNMFNVEQEIKMEENQKNEFNNIPKGIGMEPLQPEITNNIQNNMSMNNMQNNTSINNIPGNTIKPAPTTQTIFDNFDFIEVKDDRERKNDDAEIIDFDL